MKKLANFAAMVILLFSGVTARAQQSCAPSTLQTAAHAVKSAQMRLLAIQVPVMDENVSPDTSAEIAAFKHAIAAAIQDWIVCRAGLHPAAQSVQKHLAIWLGANQPTKPSTATYSDRPAADVYGARLMISVRELNSFPEILGIQAGFGIPCGDDNQLMLFERTGEHWHRVLLWQSGPYKKISGAFGDFFDYVLLPPPVAGKWELAAVHGMPWCTSRFSAFKVDLLQLMTHGSPQRLLFHYNGNYNRGVHAPTINTSPHGFQLTIETPSLDLDQFTKTSIYRFRIQGDEVRRIQPIATTPVGFVDSWLQSKWIQAQQWSDPGQFARLQNQHSALESTWKANYPELTYKSARSCSDTHDNYQVQLQVTIYQKQRTDRIKQLYFLIHKTNHAFTMLAISPHANPGCNGPNTLTIHQ